MSCLAILSCYDIEGYIKILHIYSKGNRICVFIDVPYCLFSELSFRIVAPMAQPKGLSWTTNRRSLAGCKHHKICRFLSASNSVQILDDSPAYWLTSLKSLKAEVLSIYVERENPYLLI